MARYETKATSGLGRRGFQSLPGGSGEALKTAGLSLAILGGFLLLWSRLAQAPGSGAGLPGPLETFGAAWELLSDPFYDFGPNDKGLGWQAGYSLARLLTGYGLAAAAAVVLGLLIGLNQRVFLAVNPYIQMLKTVSPLAWMPLFLYTVRHSGRSAILVIVMSTLWPIVTNTAFGVRNIDKDYLNVARFLQLSWFRRLYKVVLPAAAPAIFVGLRIAVGSAWIALVAAEMLVGGTGLGYFLWNEWNNLALANVIVTIMVVGCIGYGLDTVLARLERLVGSRA